MIVEWRDNISQFDPDLNVNLVKICCYFVKNVLLTTGTHKDLQSEFPSPPLSSFPPSLKVPIAFPPFQPSLIFTHQPTYLYFFSSFFTLPYPSTFFPERKLPSGVVPVARVGPVPSGECS